MFDISKVDNFIVTKEIDDLVNVISKKVVTKKYKKEISIPNLRKMSKIKLTEEQINLIKDENADVSNLREIRIIKNAYDAYLLMNQINPYDYNQLFKVHSVFTNGLVVRSGLIRNSSVWVVRRKSRTVDYAPPAKEVESLLMSMFDWLNKNKDNYHPLVLSSLVHLMLVCIHPFFDGNGRLSRYWQSAILSKWNEYFLYNPIESHIKSNQIFYYNLIDKVNDENDCYPFVIGMLKIINSMLDSN